MIGWWAARPHFDWVLATGAVLSWRAARALDLVGPLQLAGPDARRALYTQAGTIGTTAIGLFVVPVTLALALAPRERLQRVLAHKKGQLRAAAMQAGTAAIVLLVFTVVAVALDATPTGNRAVRCLAPGVFVAALLSLVRVLRTLGALMLLSEVEARPSLADELRPVPVEPVEPSSPAGRPKRASG